MKWLKAALVAGFFLAAPAVAQIAPGGGVQQQGSVTPNDCALWVGNGILKDGACAGAAILSLTGDVTATGPGAAAATLATVNSNVGTFGSASLIPSLTVNAKGLITAVSTNASSACPVGTSGATCGLLSTANTLSALQTFSVTNGSQANFQGWDSVGGASALDGSITLGSASSFQGAIHYSAAGNTNFYIDNTYNSPGAEIDFRMLTAVAAVTPLKLTSVAATLTVPVAFASSTTGASVQTFTNSPCGTLTTERWIPITITGQTGTWNIPACQ